jgi:TonB family protein
VVGAAAQERVNLDRRISMDVKGVAPRRAFEMIARAVKCTLALDPKVTRPLTIRVTKITTRTALDAVCESIGCRWRLDGRTLRVEAEAPSAQPAAPAAPPAGQPRPVASLPSGVPVYEPGPGITPLTVLYEERPNFPKEEKQAGKQGTVQVEFIVLPDGTVGEPHVTQSLSPAFDEEALRTVRQWRFAPPRLNGKPVAIRTHLEFAWTLR